MRDLRCFNGERMMVGPLAFMGTLVTVRSVRFMKRLRKTPVSLVKLLMEEKEWRLVEREEGK